jgi:hypothetical protein
MDTAQATVCPVTMTTPVSDTGVVLAPARRGDNCSVRRPWRSCRPRSPRWWTASPTGSIRSVGRILALIGGAVAPAQGPRGPTCHPYDHRQVMIDNSQ